MATWHQNYSRTMLLTNGTGVSSNLVGVWSTLGMWSTPGMLWLWDTNVTSTGCLPWRSFMATPNRRSPVHKGLSEMTMTHRMTCMYDKIEFSKSWVSWILGIYVASSGLHHTSTWKVGNMMHRPVPRFRSKNA